MATNPVAPAAPDRFGSSAATTPPASANLASGQTPAGSATSTHVVDRGADRGPGVLKIVSTIGATPTVTVAIEGSLDGSDWYAVPYKDTPIAADSISTFVITTATTLRKFLVANQAWRFLRLSYTGGLNVTLTVDYFA